MNLYLDPLYFFGNYVVFFPDAEALNFNSVKNPLTEKGFEFWHLLTKKHKEFQRGDDLYFLYYFDEFPNKEEKIIYIWDSTKRVGWVRLEVLLVLIENNMIKKNFLSN